MNDHPPITIGIVGTGYMSRNFFMTFQNKDGITIKKVLTRRKMNEIDYPDKSVLTNSIDELIDTSDIIYECSGDAIHSTYVIDKAITHHKRVVTSNTEFHVTAGSYFADKQLITEAEGDQPGALAKLHFDALNMRFRPLAYVNMKGFLNHYPNEKDMHFWAAKNKISLRAVTAFTDGTKIQMEQALVANGLGATFAEPGMLGLENSDYDQIAEHFALTAKQLSKPLSDYIIFPGAPHGIFIVAEHDACQQDMLRYVKMGEGPYYILRQDAILLHLQVINTIRDFYQASRILLDNSTKPEINVASVAKRKLKAGEKIDYGIGSFDVRGVGVKIKDNQNAVPIGLMANAIIKNTIEPEQMITFADIEIPDSLALKAWTEINRSQYVQC